MEVWRGGERQHTTVPRRLSDQCFKRRWAIHAVQQKFEVLTSGQHQLCLTARTSHLPGARCTACAPSRLEWNGFQRGSSVTRAHPHEGELARAVTPPLSTTEGGGEGENPLRGGGLQKKGHMRQRAKGAARPARQTWPGGFAC
jgi:hypothetical protein